MGGLVRTNSCRDFRLMPFYPHQTASQDRQHVVRTIEFPQTMAIFINP